jgi:hypothetical protein
VWSVDRGCKQVSTASLVTWQGCGTWGVAKRHVSGVSVVNWVDGTGTWGVLRVQVSYAGVSELWAMVLNGAEQGIPLSTVTW